MSGEDDQSSCSSASPDPESPPPVQLSSAPTSGKHLHFPDPGDEEEEEEKIVPEVIERSTPSTVRVDSSDLISRCQDFLANPTANLVVVEEENDIPDHLSKESGEASSTASSDDVESEAKSTKRKKKKKKKKKKLKTVPIENEPLPQS